VNSPVNNAEKARWLADQIELRLRILSEKIEGQHSDLAIPPSLTKVREWVNEELCIERISSPSSFVTTHQEHGRKIEKIAKHLNTIKRLKKPPKKPRQKKLTEFQRKNKELNESLTNAANQFVQYSQEAKRLREELLLSKSKEEGLIEELDEVKRELQIARDEIIQLRKKLGQYEVRKTSKVTRVEFGRGDKNEK